MERVITTIKVLKNLLNSPTIKSPHLLYVILKLKCSEMIYREQILQIR